MPIAPAPVKSLLAAYDGLVNASKTLAEAASDIAPSAVGEVMCSIGGLASLASGPFGPYQSPGSGNRTLSDMGAILQSACEVPPPTPGGPVPPFSGGQCNDALYLVEVSRFDGSGASGAPTGATNFSSWGPVTPVRVETDEFGVDVYYFDQRVREGGPLTPLRVQTSLPSDRKSAAVTNVSRSDMLPDECGDPPLPDRPPGGFPPIPTLPESPIVPDGGPNGGGGYIFQPVVGPIQIDGSGNVVVPVVVNVYGPSLSVPVTIPVTVNLPDFSPTINIGGSGGVSNPGQPYDPGNPPRPLPPVCCDPRPTPGNPVESEPDEPIEDEPPPPGKRLVGLLVEAVVDASRAKATEIFQGEVDGALWVPRLANVYFRVAATTPEGEQSQGETVDKPLKLLRQYFPAPEFAGVVGWRVVPEKGVRIRATPLFVVTNEPPEEAEE